MVLLFRLIHCGLEMEGVMTSIQATKNAMSADSAIAAKQKLT
jgi:hypothetical protein